MQEASLEACLSMLARTRMRRTDVRVNTCTVYVYPQFLVKRSVVLHLRRLHLRSSLPGRAGGSECALRGRREQTEARFYTSAQDARHEQEQAELVLLAHPVGARKLLKLYCYIVELRRYH